MISHKNLHFCCCCAEEESFTCRTGCYAVGGKKLQVHMVGCFVFIQTPGNKKNWTIIRKPNSGSNII